MITGSTSGIGKETALALADLDYEVIIHGRDRKRGEKVVKELKSITGNDMIKLVIADFSSLDQVHDLSNYIKDKYDSLDVLINNAGMANHKLFSDKYFSREALVDNDIEITFMVNYLATFLLTDSLIPIMKHGYQSRIINVSSAVHFDSSLDLDMIKNSSTLTGFRAYKESKLAMILYTYKLAKVLQKHQITVNCLHPGVIRTRLMRENRIFDFIWRYAPFLRSPKKGAETSIFLATSEEMKRVTGKYFVDKKEVVSSKESYDLNLMEKLWDLSYELIK